MKNNFEESDPAWLDAARAAREKKVPAEILKNFSAQVENKIHEKQNGPAGQTIRSRLWIPALVPVLGGLVLLVWGILSKEPFSARTTFQTGVSFPAALAVVSDFSEDIAALEELGIWTEADDRAIDSEWAEVPAV